MATGREVAGSLTQRVVDEFRRTGIVPAELTRSIQAATARRSGSIVPTEEVERLAREWIEGRLAMNERKPKRVKHADDSVERAIHHLRTSSPHTDAEGWATAVCTVENAWRAGEVSKDQQAQLDRIDTLYGARLGV